MKIQAPCASKRSRTLLDAPHLALSENRSCHAVLVPTSPKVLPQQDLLQTPMQQGGGKAGRGDGVNLSPGEC